MKDHIDTTYVVDKCFFYNPKIQMCVGNIFVTSWWVFQHCTLSICCSNPYYLNKKWDTVSSFNLPSVLRYCTQEVTWQWWCVALYPCQCQVAVTYSHMICHMVWIWISRGYLLVFPFKQQSDRSLLPVYSLSVKGNDYLQRPCFSEILEKLFFSSWRWSIFQFTPCVLKICP